MGFICRMIRLWCKHRRISKYRRLYQEAKKQGAYAKGDVKLPPKRPNRLKRFAFDLFTCCYFRGKSMDEGAKTLKVVFKHPQVIRLGFFFMGMSFAWFLFLVAYNFDSTSKIFLTVKSLTLVSVISLGMAFSLYLRTLICLLFPIILTSKGRYIIFLLIMNIVLYGPIVNMRDNLSKSWKAIKCIADSLYNETKKFINQHPMVIFLKGIIDHVNRIFKELTLGIKFVLQQIEDFINSLDDAFDYMIETFKQLGEAVKKSIKLMSEHCEGSMWPQYAKCSIFYGFQNPLCIAPIGICLLSAIDRVVSDEIKELMTDAYIGTLNTIRSRLQAQLKRVKDTLKSFFATGVEVTSEQKNLGEEIGNASAGFRNIATDLDNKLSTLLKAFIVFTPFSYFVIFLCGLQAWWYLKRFQLWDSYDNVYITPEIQKIDWQRALAGKPTVLPLGYILRRQYLSPWSLRMTPAELLKLQNNLIFLAVFCVVVVFFILLEYIIYTPISMVRKFAIELEEDFGLPQIQVHAIPDNTVMSSVVKSIPDSQSESAAFENFSLAACIPDPNVPATYASQQILYLLFCALAAILSQSYALRFRPIIAGFMYPARKFARAAWLYNRILSSMPAVKVDARGKLRAKVRGDSKIGQVSGFKRFMYANPCTAKIYDKIVGKRKFCIVCGAPGDLNDWIHFNKCVNIQCVAVYCRTCYAEMDDACPICEAVKPSPEEYEIDAEVGSDDDDLDVDDYQYFYIDDWNIEINDETSKEPHIDYKRVEASKGRPKDYSKYLKRNDIEEGPVDSDASTNSDKTGKKVMKRRK